MIFLTPSAFRIREYRYDAFGNALGNSIVSKMQEQPKPKTSSQNQHPDTGKTSPALFEEFDVMKAAQAQKAKQQQAIDLTEEQNTAVVAPVRRGGVNDALIEDLGAAYFAENPLYSFDLKTDLSQFEFGSSSYSGFSLNQDIMNGVGMPDIVSSDYQLDSRLSSRSGLTLEQVREASLQMITHWDQPLMLPAYDPNYELTGGAMMKPTSAANQAYQRDLLDRQQAFFGGGRPEAWHMPVSQGINQGLLDSAIAFKAGRYAILGASAVDSFSTLSMNDLSTLDNYELFGSFGAVQKSHPFINKFDDKQVTSEWKLYAGSIGLGGSVKSDYFQYNLAGTKSNVAQHVRWDSFSDVLDLNAPNILSIAEIDKSNATYGFTPGIRVNTNTQEVQASFNFKLKLPERFNIFGWSPYIGVEGRGPKK